MGAPKKPPGPIMRAAMRAVLGPKEGRGGMSDEEIRQAVEEPQQKQDERRDGGDRR